LAHEIRNPLNGAQLHVSFLERAIKKKASEQDMLEATRVVADEITRLANLVTEFLDLRGPSPCSSRASACSSCASSESVGQPQAESTGVLCPAICPVRTRLEADQGKLTQVLLNLLQNAVESTRFERCGSRWSRVRGGPRTVTIEVEDDGPGCKRGGAPIFDAFFSNQRGGTGLGLQSRNRIVTDSRWLDRCLRSARKQRFRCHLPLDDASEGTPMQQESGGRMRAQRRSGSQAARAGGYTVDSAPRDGALHRPPNAARADHYRSQDAQLDGMGLLAELREQRWTSRRS
jgi:nitrogen-specific signal transduction histidine kinase